MTDLLERLATFPRMIATTTATAAGAVASNAPEMMAEPNWFRIAVGTATILAGLGTFGLAVLRAYIEWPKRKRR